MSLDVLHAQLVWLNAELAAQAGGLGDPRREMLWAFLKRP